MLGLGLGLTKVRKPAGGGGGASGTAVDIVITVNGATPGADVTPTMLAARQLGTWTGSSWKYTNDVVPTTGHVTVTDDYDFTPLTPYKIGGTAVPNIAVGIKFDCASFPSAVASLQQDYPAGLVEYAMSCQVICKFNTPGGLAQEMDVLGGYDLGVLCVQLGRRDGSTGFGDYNPHGTVNGAGKRLFRTADRDIIFARVKGTRFMFYILTVDGDWVGSSSVTRAGGDIVLKFIQDYLAHSQTDELTYGPIYMNIGSSPLYHGTAPTFPAATNVAAAVTGDGEITLSWRSTADRFKIERWNGSVWSTVEAFYASDTVGTPTPTITAWAYVDGGLSNGDVRKYRVTALFGDDENNCLSSVVSSESNQITIQEPQPGPGTELEYSQGGSDDNSLAFRTHLSHGSKITITSGFDITRGEIRVYALGTPPAGTMTMQIWTEVGNQPAVKLYESSAVDRATLTPNAYNTVSFPGFVGTISPGDYFVVIHVSSLDPDDSHRIFWIRQNGSQIFRSSNDGTTWGDNTGPAIGELKLYSH